MTMTLLLNFITAGLRQDVYERVLRVCVCVCVSIYSLGSEEIYGYVVCSRDPGIP